MGVKHQVIYLQINQEITTMAHTSDTNFYKPRHTRADGKVAGNFS